MRKMEKLVSRVNPGGIFDESLFDLTQPVRIHTKFGEKESRCFRRFTNCRPARIFADRLFL